MNERNGWWDGRKVMGHIFGITFNDEQNAIIYNLYFLKHKIAACYTLSRGIILSLNVNYILVCCDFFNPARFIFWINFKITKIQLLCYQHYFCSRNYAYEKFKIIHLVRKLCFFPKQLTMFTF